MSKPIKASGSRSRGGERVGVRGRRVGEHGPSLWQQRAARPWPWPWASELLGQVELASSNQAFCHRQGPRALLEGEVHWPPPPISTLVALCRSTTRSTPNLAAFTLESANDRRQRTLRSHRWRPADTAVPFPSQAGPAGLQDSVTAVGGGMGPVGGAKAHHSHRHRPRPAGLGGEAGRSSLPQRKKAHVLQQRTFSPSRQGATWLRRQGRCSCRF